MGSLPAKAETSINSVDFGQMKVGEQGIRNLEFEAGQNEYLGFAFAGSQRPVVRGGFERAQAGSADRDHAPARGARASNRIDGFRRDEIALAVHAVFVEIVHAHRLEGSCADVQCGNQAHCAPRSATLARVAASKCRPAVGAATEPGVRANTV